MSEDIKTGEAVMCRNESGAKDWRGPYLFVGPLSYGASVVEHGEDASSVYIFDTVKKPPQKIYNPLTPKTFPRALTWIKNKNSTGEHLITSIGSQGVTSGSMFFSFMYLLTDCEISIDECKTWNPAGEQS